MRRRRSTWRVCLRATVLAVAIAGSALLAQDPPQPAKTEPSRAEPPKESLASWLWLDLTPGVSEALVTDSIRDQGVTVRTSAGRVFVTLPFRYDPNAGPTTISRSAIRGAAGKWFYGLRLLDVSKGLPKLSGGQGETVYERMSLKPRESGRLLVSARNSMGPRREDKGKLRQEALKGASVSAAASGWLAIIIEAQERVDILKLELAGCGELEVDLDLLRRVREEHAEAELRNPASPCVRSVLRKVEASSAATACLAIRWLSRTREAWGSDAPAAWLEQVDAMVVAAGGREEVDVRAAAWAYLASYDRLPETTQRHITRQKSKVLRRWSWLVEDHLAGAAEPRGEIATQVLAAVLACDDEPSCEAALDVVGAYAGDLQWELLRGLSAKSQKLVLARLDAGMGSTLGARWIDVLLKDGKPSLASEIASRARKFGVRIARPDHPLLLQWRRQKRTAQKRAMVTALAAADLTDVVYSAVFAELIGEATAKKADSSLRRAGFNLLIRQAERRYGADTILGRGQARAGGDGGWSARLQGSFPVRIAEKAREPLVEGLVQATREDPKRMRTDATALLLAAGFVDEAEAVVRAAETDEDRNALLQAIMEHDRSARTYGLLAMLGGLLDKEHASSSRMILQYLDETAEKLEPSDRWQLLAAVKAGVQFDRLYELSLSLEPSEALIAGQWLHELGHMSPQDRQRLAAAGSAGERLARLERIDTRRACLVDGRYGVLAIVEVLVSEEQQRLEGMTMGGMEDEEAEGEDTPAESTPAPPRYRWQAPRLVTVVLPPLQIKSSDSDPSYSVMWEGRQIGAGLIRSGSKPIRGPRDFRDCLVPAEEALLEPQGWGWMIEELPEHEGAFREQLGRAWGPTLLPVGSEETPLGGDMMVLSIGELLRAGLREALGKAEGKSDPNRWVPSDFSIVLNYGAFGSFHGVGARLRLPPARSAGKWHLQNVAIGVERID